MKFLQTCGVLLVAAIFAVGCSSTGRTKIQGADVPIIGKYGEGAGGNVRATATETQQGGASLDEPNGPLSKRIIYFVYDSSEVQPEYLSVINSHANYLASNKSASVILEGHADERGSPEYNIALGEQRTRAVAKLMKLQGVADSQIQLVSYGEEKPAVTGHDENAWQLNRRVEITYPEH